MLEDYQFSIGDRSYSVTTCEEFLVFLHDYRADLEHELSQKRNPYGGDSEWENVDLTSFLEAMEACFRGHSVHAGRLDGIANKNSWAVLAEALVMGKIYE